MRRNQVGNKRESATARVIFDTKDLNDFAEKAHFSRSLLDLEVLSELIDRVEYCQDLLQLIGSIRRWFGKGLIAKNSDCDRLFNLIAQKLKEADCNYLENCLSLEPFVRPSMDESKADDSDSDESNGGSERH
jgi:hypothetical protein